MQVDFKMQHNQSPNPTPGSVVALRDKFSGGAGWLNR
jgi:hypothetical protein